MRPCFNQSRPSHNVSRPYLNRGHRPDGNVCPSPNLGQGRQCSPSQFGLSPNEQFQDAQMFRNLDFETDRAALEELQRQGPRRPAYQPRAPRLSGLPDECLENMSFPSTGHSGGSPQMGNECLDDVSSPSILRDLSSGVISCIDDSALRNEAFIANESMPDWCNTDVSEPSAGMECIGNAPDPQCQQSTELTNVLDRFAALKRRMAADGSGPPPCPQDDCIAGAEKSTTTEIDTNAGCIVKEVVLQQSRIENGELQKTTKHIITRRDACGNETSECNESKETCAAPPREPAKARPPISPDQGVQYCGRDPYLESLACNVRRRLDFDVSDEIMNEPCPTCDEQLGDESAPIFAASLSCSPQNIGYESATQGYLVDYSAPSLEMESPISPQTRSQRMPSFQIFCDESAPADECSDNVRERSLPNRNMSMRRSPIQRSLPSAQICDMGSPSFGSSLPSSATPECLGDISAPDLAMGTPISPLSRFERMPSFEMGSQHLSAVSAPSFARSMPSPAAECSDNVGERSLPNRSMSMRSSPRPTPMPSPAQGPCPQRSMSMRGSPRVPSQQISMHSSQRSRSMPSEQICAIQEPSPCPSPSPSPSPSPCPIPSPCPPSFHESFLPSPQPEFLDDVSAPSLGRSMSMRRSPIQRSLPSAQICDMGSPSFGSSLPSSATPECLGDISAPDLAMGTPISPLSRFERMPSFEMGSQHLSAVSAPSFARSMPSPAAECSDNVGERSLPNRSMSMRSSPRPTPMPSPAQGPCPQRSMSMRGSPRVPSQQISMHSSQRSRSMPSEQICAIQEPSPCPSPSPSPSPSPCPIPSPCPPSFHESFLPSPQPEFLDDVSAPSLGRSMSMRRSPIQRSLPSAQICDMGSPSFGSSLPSSATPECLGDISAPDLAMGTPISPLSRFERMPSFEMGSQHLSAVSAPSFARSMPSPAAECSDNVRERSLPNRSKSMRSSPRPTPMPSPAQGPCPQRSMSMRGSPRVPSQQISMHSSQRSRSMPSEQICAIQEPSPCPSPSPSPSPSPCPVPSPCPPSFHESFLPSPQPEFLDEVSAPSLGRSMSMRRSPIQRSLPSAQICDMGSPSFGSSLPSSATPECLGDISAPDLAMGTPISPLSRFERMPSFEMGSQHLSAVSAPSFARSMPSPAAECSDNVRERSLPNRSMSMRRSPRPTPMPSPAQGPCPQSSIPMRGSPIQRSLPSEQISDIQEPSLYKSPPPPSFHASWLPSPQSEAMFEFTPAPFQTMPSGMTSTQDSMASDQIWDMTSPSFGSSLPSSATPEFLADISAPPLAMGTPISPLTRFQRMPSFDLSAISAPSFGTPGGSGMSSSVRDCSNVAQPPSLGRSLPSTVARSLPSQFSSAIGSGLDSEEYELYANVSLPSTFNSSHIGRPTTVGRSIPSWLSSASELSSVTRSLPSQFTPASGPGMNSEEYQKYANVSIPSTLDISNFGRRPTPVERPDRPMPSWLTTGSAPSTVPRSLPSQFSSAIGPGLNSEEYQRYANVSLPSTFDRPFRGRPCSPEAEPEPMPNEEAMYDDEQPPLPENSYRETIAITSSVHSIATRLVQDNRNISDISQPTFETVSSNQSSRSPINQNSPGGFETMANYMPFEEQFQRSPSSQRAPNRNNTNPFDDTGSSINDRCCPQVNVTFSGLPSFNATSSRNRNHTM